MPSLPRSHRIVGRWVPSAGATGFRLVDRVRSNHGTLTGMDPTSDWVVNGGKGALDFDGSNDFVFAPIPNLSGIKATLSAWVRGVPGSGSTGYIVSAPKDSAGSNGIDFRSPSNVIFDVVMQSGLVALTSGVDIRGSWNHLCGGCDGTRVFFFVNGTLVASQANTGTLDTAYTSSEINLGRFGSFGAFAACQIDDVTIYNTGLTANEAREIYRLGRGYGVFPEPDFDEGFAAAFNRRRRVLLTAG